MSKQFYADVIPGESTPLCSQAELSVQESEFNREHYELCSWNLCSDGSGTVYGLDDSINIDSNTQIYAQWIGEKLSVSYCTENNNRYIAGATYGYLYYSDDGIEWTQTSSLTGNWGCLTYG